MLLTFKDIYSTPEGRIIRIFDELYKKYGNTLGKMLERKAIPALPGKLLSDKNAYKRLQDFYHEERGAGRHVV